MHWRTSARASQQRLDRRRQRGAANLGQRQPQQSRFLRALWPALHDARLRCQRQVEMREGVLDRGQRVAQRDLGAEARAAKLRRIDVRVDLGQAPQSRPDAGRRPALEQHFAVALDEQYADRASRQDFLSAAARAVPRCDRRDVRRNRSATGHSAQRGSPRKQTVAPRSISACVYVSMSRAGKQRLGVLPQNALDRRVAGEAFHALVPREHALDVAVENRAALAAGKHRDRRRRRAADARQASRASAHRWEIRPRARRRRICAARCSKCAPPVVTQPAPLLQHLAPAAPPPGRARRETPRRSGGSTGSPSPPAFAAA